MPSLAMREAVNYRTTSSFEPRAGMAIIMHRAPFVSAVFVACAAPIEAGVDR